MTRNEEKSCGNARPCNFGVAELPSWIASYGVALFSVVFFSSNLIAVHFVTNKAHSFLWIIFGLTFILSTFRYENEQYGWQDKIDDYRWKASNDILGGKVPGVNVAVAGGSLPGVSVVGARVPTYPFSAYFHPELLFCAVGNFLLGILSLVGAIMLFMGVKSSKSLFVKLFLILKLAVTALLILFYCVAKSYHFASLGYSDQYGCAGHPLCPKIKIVPNVLKPLGRAVGDDDDDDKRPGPGHNSAFNNRDDSGIFDGMGWGWGKTCYSSWIFGIFQILWQWYPLWIAYSYSQSLQKEANNNNNNVVDDEESDSSPAPSQQQQQPQQQPQQPHPPPPPPPEVTKSRTSIVKN